MYIDIELEAAEWLALLGRLVGVLHWSLWQQVEVCHVTKQEILRIPSLVATMAQSIVRGEVAIA